MRIAITTPPNTAPDNPQITRLDYGRVKLSRVELKIPKGHAYLTGIQVRAANSERIIPDVRSNVEWFTDDDRIIVLNPNIVFDPPSFKIEIRTYNEDDTYPHSHFLDLE